MAKRKRLEPARHADARPPLETKSALPPRGPLGPGTTPPIADVARDASATAALAELATAMQTARDDGLLIQKLPLDAVLDDHMVRDRMAGDVDAGEMAVLIDSLRSRGQQTAIEVTDLGGGEYGLISGWRRLTALREIARDTPETDTVLAIVRRPVDAADAYRAMVEENEIRVGLSFYERARIVLRAVQEGVFRSEKAALASLFEFTTRSKRSKINAFIPIVRAFDGGLPFPTAVTEKQGLAMAKAMDAGGIDFQMRLRDALERLAPATPAAQAEAIGLALSAGRSRPPADKPQVTQIRSGLTMTVHPGGRVVLEGERMTEPHMIRKLQDALNSL